MSLDELTLLPQWASVAWLGCLAVCGVALGVALSRGASRARTLVVGVVIAGGLVAGGVWMVKVPERNADIIADRFGVPVDARYLHDVIVEPGVQRISTGPELAAERRADRIVFFEQSSTGWVEITTQ